MFTFYRKERIFKVTNALFILVKRHRSAVEICLMAVYKKELYFDIVTNDFSMFVERYRSAVKLGLMAVIYNCAVIENF